MALSRRTKIVVAVVAGVPLLATALIALGHTKFARGMLRGVPGCPYLEGKSVATIEQSRKQGVAILKGQGRAPSRKVLGFELFVSTKVQALSWAVSNGANCVDELNGAALRCKDVPSSAFTTMAHPAAVDDMYLRFDGKFLLVAVDALHPVKQPADAVSTLQAIEQRLTEFGKPEITGERTAAYLALEYRRTASEYRFEDLAIDVSAMHFPKGVVVREQYRGL